MLLSLEKNPIRYGIIMEIKVADSSNLIKSRLGKIHGLVYKKFKNVRIKDTFLQSAIFR